MKHLLVLLINLFLIFLVILSCSSKVVYAPYKGFSTLKTVKKGYTFVGEASYYGSKFHGKKTANGEIFDKNKLTCAHRTLPFNTILKVTNLSNNKSVIVRVNDRGPFKKSRVIDLSEAAAKKIGLTGVTRVKCEVIGFKEEKK